MVVQVRDRRVSGDVADTLIALVRAEGSGAHAYTRSEALSRGPEAARNAADVVHLIALVHGRHPGVIDHAAVREINPEMRAFLMRAIDSFAAERAVLARLVVASGPLPSTPGQAESEAAVHAQHHALDLLAQSERMGCATGAALALLADWASVRAVLNTVALRLGVEVPLSSLPDTAEIASTIRAGDISPAAERAMLFGAQQVATQHYGLWDLLEARSAARSTYY